MHDVGNELELKKEGDIIYTEHSFEFCITLNETVKIYHSDKLLKIDTT